MINRTISILNVIQR